MPIPPQREMALVATIIITGNHTSHSSWPNNDTIKSSLPANSMLTPTTAYTHSLSIQGPGEYIVVSSVAVYGFWLSGNTLCWFLQTDLCEAEHQCYNAKST